MDREQTRAHLRQLEENGWRSLCEGTGADFYGALMTEDAAMVLANGMTLDRDDVVTSLRDAPPWARFALEDLAWIDAGPGAVVLRYTGRAWRDADADPFVAAMSSLYVQVDDRWRLALYQQTPVPPG